MSKIINVANRLPVTIGPKIKKSSGGLVSALDGVKDRKLTWIGWPGSGINDPGRAKAVEKQLREEFDCIPIMLSRRQVVNYYQGFSNSSLWPLLHYMSNYVRHNSSWWEEYKNVNQAFADKVLEVVENDDIVWVHDYHLMLLPQMLRKSRKNFKIGFFLHTPFPSYEVFRCHPNRKELLEGVLGSDLIGFHTFGYLRHFRSSVIRIVGLESEMDTIPQENRHCHIGVFPIGINSMAFKKELRTRRYRNKREELDKIYSGKKIVLSVERLDYTKGLIRRLEAIDHFLSKWPDKNNIVFIFVSVPSRGDVPEYKELRRKLEGYVGRINGTHSTVTNTPVHFIHKSVSFTELCCLYSMADVAMVTPLIDGMNLVAKEYVAAKQGNKGVLLLSEFAGAAEELFKSITVNPYDIGQMVDRLKQALTVPEAEKLDRMRGMYERVIEFDARYWANSFLRAIKTMKTDDSEMVQTKKVVPEILKRLKKRAKKAFFLDYDGTLSEFVTDPKKAFPSKAMKETLKKLSKLNNTDIYICSGRPMEILEDWLGEFGFTLISEHGYRYKRPAHQTQVMIEAADMSWKEKVREVLELFVGSTPGSFVEEKVSALVWHYRRSDPEFGYWKAGQLMSSLYEVLANMPVEVHHGKKIVEVSSMQVSKGAAMDKFVKENKYDVVLCAGDDQTDETMFAQHINGLVRIKIGEGETKADYRVKNPTQFRRLLNEVASHLA